MSAHNHHNTQTDQNSIPDIAASILSDNTASVHSGVSNLTDNASQATNRSNDSSSLRRDREREGRCADCGAQTHEMQYDRESGLTRKVPLNIEGEVRRGRCLLCNPLAARLPMQRRQLQHQQHTLRGSNRTFEDINNLESVQSPGGGSVRQQYPLHDRSFNWRVSPQASYSSASCSLDGERHQDCRQNPHRGHGGRGSDMSVGSPQSYGSAPALRDVIMGSHQASEHDSSITYPLATQSASNLCRNAAPAPVEEFAIDSSRGGNFSQHQPQQQHQQQLQHYRDIRAASNRSNLVNDISIGDNRQQSHELHSTDRRHPQQQELPHDEESKIREILSSMRRYPHHIPTQSKALHSLWVLSWESANASNIGRLGGVPLIINSMRLQSDTAALQSNGISTLQNLAIDTQNRDRIIESDGVTIIADVMAQFLGDGTIQRSGCAALANLANGGAEQKSYVAERGGVLAIMRAVNVHRGDERVLRAAYHALRKLGYNPGS